MRFIPAVVFSPFLLLLVFTSNVSLSDQTDQRLKPLFTALHSQDQQARAEAEAKIWQIWFDSGDDKINELMGDGREAAQRGLYKTAESYYSKVIERAPKYSEGWNRRATIRYYLRDYEGSLEDIQQTLNLEPRHFGAIWGLGMILGSQHRYADAIVAFERLLEIKPNAVDARARIELLKNQILKKSV